MRRKFAIGHSLIAFIATATLGFAQAPTPAIRYSLPRQEFITITQRNDARLVPAVMRDLESRIPNEAQRRAAALNILAPRYVTSYNSNAQTTDSAVQCRRVREAASFDVSRSDALEQRKEFLNIAKDAIAKADNDPVAILVVSDALAQRMLAVTQCTIESPMEKFIANARTVPGGLVEADMFTLCIPVIANAQLEVFWNMQYIVGALQQMDPAKYQKTADTYYTLKNGHFRRAQDALAAKQWETAVESAQKCISVMTEDDRFIMRRVIVRGLWKQKKYDQAIYETRQAAMSYPHLHYFHYLFAVIALEADCCYHEALERALIAEPLDPTNAGLKETITKLRAKVATSADSTRK